MFALSLNLQHIVYLFIYFFSLSLSFKEIFGSHGALRVNERVLSKVRNSSGDNMQRIEQQSI